MSRALRSAMFYYLSSPVVHQMTCAEHRNDGCQGRVQAMNNIYSHSHEAEERAIRHSTDALSARSHNPRLGTEAVPSYSPSTLHDPLLRSSINLPVRAERLLHSQQTHGNRAVQRFLQGTSNALSASGRTSPTERSVQREFDPAMVQEPIQNQYTKAQPHSVPENNSLMPSKSDVNEFICEKGMDLGMDFVTETLGEDLPVLPPWFELAKQIGDIALGPGDTKMKDFKYLEEGGISGKRPIPPTDDIKATDGRVLFPARQRADELPTRMGVPGPWRDDTEAPVPTYTAAPKPKYFEEGHP